MMNTAFTRRSALVPAIATTLLLTAACGREGTKSANAAAPPRTPTEYVVAVDLSTSLTATERESHKALLRALVNEMDYGDRLVLMKAHAAGIRDTSSARTVSMPTLTGSQPLKREQDELDLQRDLADRYVTALFSSAPVNGTDLFATMHTAAERTREDGAGRRVLVVLSDMLQCAADVCMEGAGGVPDSAWIQARMQQELVPSLDNVCISVVGADASTARGVGVRDFWRRYFQMAGASFSSERYVHSASSPSVLRCEG